MKTEKKDYQKAQQNAIKKAGLSPQKLQKLKELGFDAEILELIYRAWANEQQQIAA